MLPTKFRQILHGAISACRLHFSFLVKTTLLLVYIAAAASLHAATISGTVKDPSGAVIAGARIEITSGQLPAPVVLSSDGLGRFTSPELKPGTYSVSVAREGFEPLAKTVDLQASVELPLTLAIAQQRVTVAVNEKALAFTNSDPVYRQLRDVDLGRTFRFDNFTLVVDAATFTFRKGTLTFLNPVEGNVTGAVFIGDGHFNLKPVSPLDTHELARRSGKEEFDEDFTSVVFRFTSDAHMRFVQGLKDGANTPPEAAAVFEQWKEKMRRRREESLGFTDSVLNSEDMDNVDADVLAAIYNPAHPFFLNAYVRGVKHKDLRFFMRMRVGAVPQLDSPEEVALINYDPEAMDDGIWYLAHAKFELLNGKASSSEDRRLFATHRYKIETVIAKNGHLFSTATITFEPLIAGERVLKFGLLPNLRVTRVTDLQGENLYFVQESRKQDGSFYVILPQATQLGKEYSVTVEYAGDKVVEQAGDGSFYIRARESWYPNLNGFGERALYDLTFKVPRRYTVISIGKLQSQSIEGDLAVSHWTTPIPVAVAGLNYGDYKKIDLLDEKTGFHISGYYLTELPDMLRGNPALQSMAPGSMTKYALDQTRAQLQICTYFFGKLPYDNINITEQPDFAFGQSWPNLIYLPISAYIDSTQRWMLFGRIDNNFSGFVREVTPHEVSHQWWGHTVGWSSYHDQWLSEGFAEFSAGLFMQFAYGGKWQKDYIEFWDRLRRRILDKNNYGVAPNDAGPLWMGLRLISPRTENAYQNVTYPKGAYILQMLRSMMHETGDKDPDANFIAMMHDFVSSYSDRPASTEDFEAIAAKHMTKLMDVQKNGRMDWFFREWVYGTEVPKYQFNYQLTPADGGKVKLHMTITQSEVDDNFVMLVPVDADFGNGMVRLGQVGIGGNSTRTVDIVLPKAPAKVAFNAYKEILER
jgi:hypothetical protein